MALLQALRRPGCAGAGPRQVLNTKRPPCFITRLALRLKRQDPVGQRRDAEVAGDDAERAGVAKRQMRAGIGPSAR